MTCFGGVAVEVGGSGKTLLSHSRLSEYSVSCLLVVGSLNMKKW